MLRASLIIPTYNRSSVLARTLDQLSWVRQRHLSQVIICDDGSTDDTTKVCASFRAILPLEYCRHNDDGFRAAAARNMGIRRATGDVLIFLDDDCLPLPGFVAAHCAVHAGAAPVVGLGLRHRLTELPSGGSVDARLLAAGEPDDRDPFIRRETFQHPYPWKLAYSCNLSIRRDHPEAFFDQRFRGWGMEDTDLGYRLWRSHTAYRVVDGASVLHIEDCAPRDPFRREALSIEPDYTSYLRNCRRILDKYPDETQLWESLLPDLQWYRFDSARGRWLKDGQRHDPMEVLDEMARPGTDQISPVVVEQPVELIPRPTAGTSTADLAPQHMWAMDRSLDEIAIELTVYCNLSCVMCSVWQGREHGVSYEVAMQTMADARSLGAATLTPCGAETFMRRDAVSLLEQADAMGFTAINIVTNGLLLTASKLDRLAKLPSVHLNLSLDGPRVVHDSLRGSNSYDRLLRVLGEIRRREIPFALSTVIMRQTLDTVESVLDLASSLGVAEVSLQPYQPEIGGPGADHCSFCFTPDEEGMLQERLAEITQYADALGIDVFTEHILTFAPGYLARGIRPIPNGGCFVPSRFLLVDFRGDVYPCFFMRNRPIGNVTRSSVRDLWHGEVQRSLNVLALTERCPGCLAACSDIPAYNAIAGRATS